MTTFAEELAAATAFLAGKMPMRARSAGKMMALMKKRRDDMGASAHCRQHAASSSAASCMVSACHATAAHEHSDAGRRSRAMNYETHLLRRAAGPTRRRFTRH